MLNFLRGRMLLFKASVTLLATGTIMRLRQLAILAILISSSTLAETEILLELDSSAALAVYIRNELSYEKIAFHAKPGRHRIAKVNFTALQETASFLNLSLFPDLPPLKIKSNGITKRTDRFATWNGTIIRSSDTVPEHEAVSNVFDSVSLDIETMVYDSDLDQYFEVPAGFREEMITNWAPGDPILAPFPVGPGTRIVRSYNGEIDIYVDNYGYVIVRISSLEQEPDHVLIYEADPSKTWDITEDVPDPNSETGRRYYRQKEELDEHIKKVKARIRQRNN